ncbi:MAG: glycosyltransferase family 4 protein [Bacteroidetes bacterium]|nr:glycosyltransferase family 4 protein [Bacteroidota bacterium]
MKVAVFSGNIPSTTFIENLIRNLSSSGVKVLLFGKKFREVKYNENVEVLDTPDSGFSLLFFLAKESVKLIFRDTRLYFRSAGIIFKSDRGLKNNLRELGALLPILNNQPDIFHIQWAKTLQRNPYLFELLKCRFALSLRGAHINYSPINDPALAESYRKYFPAIDGFHAVSEAIAKEAVKYGADIKKINVIYSSVSEKILKNEIAFKKNHGEEIRIISIGRFHWKKGYHYALDAMKILIGKKIKFRYTIVAQGEIPEEILFILNDPDLKKHIELKSGMDHEKLMSEMRSSDMLILPSVEEGIANVVLEAMAAGIPVISTDCGGMKEAVSDGENGILIKVRDPELLAEKISELSHYSYESKSEMILNARKTIAEKFSEQNQKDGFINFYNSILKY